MCVCVCVCVCVFEMLIVHIMHVMCLCHIAGEVKLTVTFLEENVNIFLKCYL